MENIISVGTKKRGRKPKGEKQGYILNKEKTKFIVNVTRDQKSLEMIFDLLLKANKKEFGREITFKDLSLYGLKKLTNKDIEKIQENSLGKMEKVERHLKEYNEKNGTDLGLGDFLVKKLNIN